MPGTSTPRRRGLQSALWLVANLLLLGACEELDPVYTTDLCRGNRVFSENCDACRNRPYAIQCPQCVDQPDNPDCEPPQPITGIDGGSPSGGNGASGTDAANGGTGRGRNGEAGAAAANGGSPSGAGVPAANGGSGFGPPPSGQAGDGPMSGSAGTPGETSPCPPCGETRPICNTRTMACVQCLSSADCGNKQCDLASNLCENCVDDLGCSGQTCNKLTHQCVECQSNEQCTDGVRDVCAENKCVDCEGSVGCSADHPACIGQKCYECADDNQCPNPLKHRCLRTDHICVECLGNLPNECPTALPVCDAPNLTCVQCLAATDCTSGHCVGKSCAECESDADCPDPGRAKCSNNQCVPCDAQTQCAHIATTPACDTTVGKCVQCVDDSTCDGTSCVHAKRTCSNVTKGTLDPCVSCEADTQCKATLKCVPMSDGSFCLYVRADVVRCANSETSPIRPFTRSQPGTSVDGYSGTFCAPSPGSCQLYIDARNQKGCMADPSACNPGEACLPTGDNAYCTYGCESSTDCPPAGLSVCSTSGNRLCSPP